MVVCVHFLDNTDISRSAHMLLYSKIMKVESSRFESKEHLPSDISKEAYDYFIIFKSIIYFPIFVSFC